jgi:hypothetical protein
MADHREIAFESAFEHSLITSGREPVRAKANSPRREPWDVSDLLPRNGAKGIPLAVNLTRAAPYASALN